MTPRAELIARLEKATGADRKLDLAISVAINFKGAFWEGEWSWGAGGDEIVGTLPPRHSKKKLGVGYLDPVQFVPRWTESIDAALTLVPDNYWLNIETAGETPGPNQRRWPIVKFGRWNTKAQVKALTIPLALCIAALKAMSAQ